MFGTPTLKLNGTVLDLQKLTPRVPHRTGQGRDEVSALTALPTGSRCPPPSPAPRRASGTSGLFPVRAYAMCILAGIVLAVWITQRRLTARGGAPGEALDVAA